MIIKANNDDHGWVLIDGVDWIQYDTEHSKLHGDIVIDSAQELNRLYDETDSGDSVLLCPPEKPTDGYFPFKIGRLFYRVANKQTEGSPHTLWWRGALYVMNDNGKTVESLYMPY